MSKKIKFGTDGWRAIIADDYTVENVARVTVATAEWLKQNFDQPSVVIGHDCRFSGALFTETAVKVFINAGIPVKMAIGFVSTPMVSLGAVKLGCSIGVVITASHNPPSYNGFKLKSHHGGPLSPEKVQEVEDIIPEVSNIDLASISMDSDLIEVIDLETMYVDHAKANFDLDAIEKSGLVLAYDAMYGSGQNALKRLLPNTHFLHCENNPSFMGQAPEPIAKNLQELESFIKERGDIDCALATDGDADRIGLYNGSGEFIDSHHIILLLIHYLKHYKGMTGKVATAFSTTPRVKVMADHYGLESEVVKIGFKYIASIMIEEDVLVGGEESGGIATKGHIPERDGIWMGLIIWEFMAKSGKTLDDLIREVYEIVGPFKFERSDLHITEELKQKIVANCKADHYKSFGEYQVKEVGTIDGFKYFFDENRWVMIRPSGTEPVLRTYAEAPTMEEVRKILQVTKETICG
ncbi:MAG: phosphoglucomutase/phosphomannomutase family protein [Crocinitomicaceae bacterium]|nr:phosphoglucomutase/phosphomannomutase family protein [Crocinitomicaceae bacterium]MDC0099687.1 phosphoglucomutase/phosphomannomutase family protein [Crocinitomicaceae bacterium]MDC1385196.1 phosphoglucomutase/phosphomannomutase family protein [Crocinitomicaceae bacterium]